ncbi:cap [Macaca mulatta feces associated virus 4]|uniref:Cap n=1 Tax=Macaca mulatta feces associated virus 4 TaxID=2499226 RepID=A0A1W5PVU6_9VIRU|nr:cap [Macaca mulatta feces associated virus 4]APG55824.1 cap [Macaca mulatta feces associated virus 4]
MPEGLTAEGTIEGDRVVSVRVSETYDLSTQVGKMGIVGIHTPIGTLVERMWSGLVRQYGKFRFKSCDVAMACASMLPADPLQIGVEAGAIAPQDMFNPILYKAVSNDTMNTFLQYIQGQAIFNTGSTSGNIVNFGSVIGVNDSDFKTPGDAPTSIDQFQMYYGLLSDPSGWRKAMPQSGLVMRGLRPLVYNIVSSYGLNEASGAGVTGAPKNDLKSNQLLGNARYTTAGARAPTNGSDAQLPDVVSGGQNVYQDNPVFGSFKGRSQPMPWINTKFWPSAVGNSDGSMITETESTNKDATLQSNVGRVPPAYVGLIVLPPAKLNQLYYRIKVTWTIEFSELQSNLAVSNWQGIAKFGALSYATDYASQSKAMNSIAGMVDTSDADVEKIMEGA